MSLRGFLVYLRVSSNLLPLILSSWAVRPRCGAAHHKLAILLKNLLPGTAFYNNTADGCKQALEVFCWGLDLVEKYASVSNTKAAVGFDNAIDTLPPEKRKNRRNVWSLGHRGQRYRLTANWLEEKFRFAHAEFWEFNRFHLFRQNASLDCHPALFYET